MAFIERNSLYLLELDQVQMSFGGLVALNNVSLGVKEGELFAIIGPNGAGKTTLFNCVNGLYKPTKGRIIMGGHDITRLPPHKRVAMGLARTFQNVELFKRMTVLDNLLLGKHQRLKTGPISTGLFWGRMLREELTTRLDGEKIVDFLEMEHVRAQQVGALPYGLQKRVELGRALAMDSKILLLDEPVAGMNQEETEDMARFILDIHEELGITIIMVEHHMDVVMDICERICVLNYGNKIAEGCPREIQGNQDVRNAYLGEGDMLN